MKWLNVRLTNLSYSNHVRGYPLYPAYRLGPFQSHAAPGSPQASTALRNLSLTESLELSFLNKALKKKPAPLLDRNGEAPRGVEVEPVGK